MLVMRGNTNKRRGFISIIALIIMSVLMIMILYFESTTRYEYLILNSTKNNIQAYYLSEGKIHMVLNEDKYYKEQLLPMIFKYFRSFPITTPLTYIKISKEDLILGDNKSTVKVDMIDNDNRKQLKLISESDFNGLKSTTTSYLNIVNELFDLEIPVLDRILIDDFHGEDLENLLIDIGKNININDNRPSTIYGVDLSNFNNIILEKIDNNIFQVSSFRENMTEPYVERFTNKSIIMILRHAKEESVNLLIQNTNGNKGTISLSGVIYVEGDITISSDFEFKGVIIVKNGEIKVDPIIKPKIKGIMITDNLANHNFIENMDIVYNRENIYKYGTYVPGFLDPNIIIIKGN